MFYDDNDEYATQFTGRISNTYSDEHKTSKYSMNPANASSHSRV